MTKNWLFFSSWVIFIVFALLAFVPPAQAVCTGSTTCHYYGNCKWSETGEDCKREQKDEYFFGKGTCQCQELTGISVACSDCGIANGCFPFCGTLGTPVTPGTASCEWVTTTCQATYCGDGICNGSETSTSCSGDCPPPASTPVCGNGTCESGESSSSCPDDCGSGGSCGSCSTCNYSYGPDECRLDSNGGCVWDSNCGGGCNNPGGCPPPCNITDNRPYCIYYGVNTGGCTGPYCSCCPGLKENSSGTCLCPCPDIDAGTPGLVTYTSPAPPTNEIKLDNNGQVVITWDREENKKADKYEYRVVKEGSTTPLCTAENYATCGTTDGHFDPQRRIVFYPNVNGGNRYTVYVRGKNTSCNETKYSNWATATFTITDDIDTEYHLSTDGSCTGDNPVNPGRSGARGVVTVTGGAGVNASRTINGSQTTKTINVPYWPNPLGNYTVTLTPGEYAPGQAYSCTCPNGCVFNGTGSPTANPLKFYVSTTDLSNTAWYQVKNGNVLAHASGGTAVYDPIPTTTCSEPACIPTMITKDKDNTPDSAGIAMTGGGSIDSSDEQGSQTGYVTDRATQAFAVGTGSDIKENYDYFYRQYSMAQYEKWSAADKDDFASTSNDARKPDLEPLGGKRAYYRDGDLTIQSQWSVGSNEKLVIFVHGNLTIADPAGVESLIDVTEGGFLAFIVSGDITIESSVGNANLDNTTSNIEGVYIADGIFTVESKGAAAGGDKRFVAEGTYVGWNRVVLERDFSDGGARKAENNTRPAELFVFRPDFVLNVPERMAKPAYLWQEAAP